MDIRLKKLVDTVNFKMFETMVLMNQAYCSNTVISSDIGISGREKYYELWDEYEDKLTLLIVSDNESFCDGDAIISANDGYNDYIFAYPDEKQKLEMLCRFYVEQGDSVPPFMKGIKEEIDKLSELFDEMIEE